MTTGLEQVTAADIQWRLAGPSPWPSTQPVLGLAVEALPVVTDNLAADLVEQLALAFTDLQSELRAGRAVVAASLALAHSQHLEIRRLRHRVGALLGERLAARGAA
jgi:hypothetical protein